MRKHHDNETFRARSLLERGDGGYRPGDRYPTLSKGSFYDEVFAATFGRSKKEHDDALEYQARQFARDSSCRIPDDCIDSNRYPLFMARAVLKELIESLQSTQGVKPC